MLAERLWDLGSEEEEDEEMRLRLIVLLLGLLLLVVSVRFCCFGVATVPGQQELRQELKKRRQ